MRPTETVTPALDRCGAKEASHSNVGAKTQGAKASVLSLNLFGTGQLCYGMRTCASPRAIAAVGTQAKDRPIVDDTHSFVVRIWYEGQDLAGKVTAWRGSVEHVGRESDGTLWTWARSVATFRNTSGGWTRVPSPAHSTICR